MKITLSRIFETSKALATKPGQELQDFINFVGEMSEQILRALRNGITFEDNVRCQTPTVSLVHNTEQIVNTNGKVPKRVIVTRVISTQYALDAWLWFLDSQGRLVVKVKFSDAPTGLIDVDLLIFYE